MEPCPVSMHTGNGTFRALADRLRSLGWMDTIPLEGKRPLVSRRHGTARKHVSGFDLDEWQSLYPNANVGIVLPTLDAGDMMVMAIDVDSAAGHERKEDGAVVLTALERELGPLPATWTNGHTDPPYRHLLYRMPNVPHLTAPGAGLDLAGEPVHRRTGKRPPLRGKVFHGRPGRTAMRTTTPAGTANAAEQMGRAADRIPLRRSQ